MRHAYQLYISIEFRSETVSLNTTYDVEPNLNNFILLMLDSTWIASKHFVV